MALIASTVTNLQDIKWASIHEPLVEGRLYLFHQNMTTRMIEELQT